MYERTHFNATERRENSLANRIWAQTDTIMQERFGEAQADGEHDSPRGAVQTAYEAQLKYLDNTDTDDMSTGELTANRLALLLLEMPMAGHAQHMLNAADAYDTSRNKEYVGILSDFNNDLAATLAHMPPSMMENLPAQLLQRNNQLIRGRWHAPSMDADDLYRSLRGVKREVAFWRALHNDLPEGWEIRQSDTQEDLHGTDFVVTDTENHELRVDVKARQRFHDTLVKLATQGWISREELHTGIRQGFVYKPNTDRNGQRDGTFTCIFDADRLGIISNYQYDSPDRVQRFVQERMNDRHITAARKIGRHAIPQARQPSQ